MKNVHHYFNAHKYVSYKKPFSIKEYEKNRFNNVHYILLLGNMYVTRLFFSENKTYHQSEVVYINMCVRDCIN